MGVYMDKLVSQYQDFMISSFENIEMTKLSKIVGCSHDKFTKGLLLNRNIESDEKLWDNIKPFLRDYESEDDGCLLVDDSLLHKPYTKVNEVVNYHYDHVSGKSVKGIMMLNFHYTDSSGISIPLGYEIITKSEDVWSKEYQKNIKKSMFTKNEIMRDKLNILHFHNELKYGYILFDKWFSSTENLEFIHNTLKKKFITPSKSNRLVALSLEDKNNGKYVSISSVDTGGSSSRFIYLKGCDIPLKLIKLTVKDNSDGENSYLYLITNNIDISTDKALEIYKRRWKIEEYHKSLKQNLKIEHSPTKIEISQRNHIHLAVLAFIKLEKLRLNYKMNHFAIKEKIYIEALKIAFEKVQQLKIA